jgi:hypothetical protein
MGWGGARVPGLGKKIGRPSGSKTLPKPQPGDRIQAYLAQYPHHDPVILLLRFANDEGLDIGERIKAAIGAAPYCHSRLSTINLHRSFEAPSQATIDKLRDLMGRAMANPIVDVTPEDKKPERETEVINLSVK